MHLSEVRAQLVSDVTIYSFERLGAVLNHKQLHKGRRNDLKGLDSPLSMIPDHASRKYACRRVDGAQPHESS